MSTEGETLSMQQDNQGLTGRIKVKRSIPTGVSDGHVDRPVTDTSIAAFQSDSNFVTGQFVPYGSAKRSDEYFVYNQSDLARLQVAERAPNTPAERGGFEWTPETFRTKKYDLATEADLEAYENQDAPLDAEADAMSFLNMQMKLNSEKRWADTCFKAGVWGLDITGVGSSPSGSQVLQWNVSGSTPLDDIEDAKSQVQASSGGFEPNTVIMGRDVWRALCRHPDVLDLYKANGTGEGARQTATLRAIAELLEVERVLVSRAVINSAKKGATTANALVMSKGFWLGYYDPNPRTLRTMTAFRRFAHTGRGKNQGLMVKRYETDNLDSLTFEMSHTFVDQVVVPAAGAFFASVIA